jgi:hypothetical protein
MVSAPKARATTDRFPTVRRQRSPDTANSRTLNCCAHRPNYAVLPALLPAHAQGLDRLASRAGAAQRATVERW